MLISLVINAGVLGLIVAAMEEDGFPGWWEMIICVFAALVPAYFINEALPPHLFVVGLAVGAICAGCAISALLGMTVKRACIAAGIYLAIMVVLELVVAAMFA